jgi:putative hydrolases of HD superfamily
MKKRPTSKKIPASERKDITLLYELGALRHIDRTWKQFAGPGVANIAEHHFRVAWIAFFLAQKEGVADIAKVLSLAFIHDVAESRTGDVNFVSRQYADRHEDKAAEAMFLGTSAEKELGALFAEYQERKTPESHIVKDADMIDVELELQEMRAKGLEFAESWKRHREVEVFPKLKTKSAQEMWKAIHSGIKPYDWHNESIGALFKNRDWFKKK